jgi:hypothetical protein
VLHATPVEGACWKPEQLVRNAVYYGTRSGYAASGRRPGRSYLLTYRLALPQALGLSAELAGSQKDYVLWRCIGKSAPRFDALCGTVTRFCLRDPSVPAV